MRELERKTNFEEIPGKLAIIGAGNLGTSFAAALDSSLEVRLAGRDDALAAAAAAETVLLCVPDAAIADAAAATADAEPLPRFVGHTSGATPLDALAPVARLGA